MRCHFPLEEIILHIFIDGIISLVILIGDDVSADVFSLYVDDDIMHDMEHGCDIECSDYIDNEIRCYNVVHDIRYDGRYDCCIGIDDIILCPLLPCSAYLLCLIHIYLFNHAFIGIAFINSFNSFFSLTLILPFICVFPTPLIHLTLLYSECLFRLTLTFEIFTLSLLAFESLDFYH